MTGPVNIDEVFMYEALTADGLPKTTAALQARSYALKVEWPRISQPSRRRLMREMSPGAVDELVERGIIPEEDLELLPDEEESDANDLATEE